MSPQRDTRCLVVGATGYVGGRLVPALLAAGHRVRCLVRSPAKPRAHGWAGQVEVVRGDILDPESVAEATRDVDIAYHLVHSIGGGADFEERDRRAARIFGERARAAGVRRVVHLSGLTPAGVPERELSPHLRSRAEVGRLLLASGVPTAVLRAAVVIGSGSASFEMLRHLTERLPVMVTPRWVRTRVQPIAIADVVRLLVGCADLPADVNRSFDIGGPDVVTYEEMMRSYARRAGLPRRLILPVPVLTPGLSSLWIGLVTPVPGDLARPLAESLRHEVVCHERDIERYVPPPAGGWLGLDLALAAALERAGEDQPDQAALPADSLRADPDWAGASRYVDERSTPVDASPEALWRVVEAVGGDTGWYSAPLAWTVRGWLDRLFGGAGGRRGRPHPTRLERGDPVDFWRVEALDRGRLLRLRAELRLPGDAWLELRVERDDEGRTRYRQRAVFRPRGLLGHAYWWAISPFHAWVFGGMTRTIAERAGAESGAAGERPPHPRDLERA
ncbi:SDR family oxidoreductase [Streptomyces millisiae]|uniref:SDR family oxidoreductase n=1 Tax=Streptomyces millisiae TaxID=3075542 RepID=A0ABU2LKE4_9ACTN|nr:SDR family oxidoreductase [Streptomyces sp. DSM 44918]MDT0318056.1 SDR family oxidoreductase [Streptomyces sp. DSM 44918]